MSRQNQRRLAALKAMAEQDTSPEEAAIAKVKLRELEAVLRAEDDTLTVWQRRLMAEAAAARHQALLDEAERATLVKRWERGTFTGMTIKAGAVTRLVEPR